MKEFNLDEFKKNLSQKVVTRDGRSVRIICTDCNNNFPIVALVYDEKKQKEDIECFLKNGKYLYLDNDANNLDLFFAPVKREGWVNLYKDEDITYSPGIIHDSEKEAKEAIKNDPYFIATIKIEWEE